jgi:DNA-binding NarL/FixJ family response regulator
MSIQSSVTIVLANRPRLFRELLQHALNTASPQFHVVEAADAMPSHATLQNADWLIVDEESATAGESFSADHPHLGILVLDGRGSRARILAPAPEALSQPLSEVPTLSQLFELLAHEPTMSSTNSTN